MVFRRRSMAMRPIHRLKHVVDASGTLAAGTVVNQIIALSVDAPVLANTTNVESASKVYGIFIKVIVASNEATVAGAIPNVYFYMAKNPGGNLTFQMEMLLALMTTKNSYFIKKWSWFKTRSHLILQQ